MWMYWQLTGQNPLGFSFYVRPLYKHLMLQNYIIHINITSRMEAK